jgi:ribosomal protein S18 acetylase RimI-like enzyme
VARVDQEAHVTGAAMGETSPMRSEDVDLLHYPVWHALTGAHARFAEGDGSARRYPPEVAALAALPDEPSPDDWSALAGLIATDGSALLFRPDGQEVPDGWTVPLRVEGVQLAIGPEVDLPIAGDVELVQLGPDDVEDMVELVERAEPGPFERRTVEMGLYLGVRSEGALIAMAGQRLRLDGHDGPIIEISAVCTDPDRRGEGLGTALVIEQIEIIRGSGGIPVMHVRRDNTVALSIYEHLGFRTVRTFEGLVVAPPA